MTRKNNTDSNGAPWSEKTKLLVWSKATTIPNYSPESWRRDLCNFAIMYADFGDRESMYGWEIDHIYPVALGGNDDLNNLQVLNCKNNEEKGDSLDWTCPR